ncbi:hypothetical protein P3T23_007848 [Paraburkholderia sp. GAS448]|jgi:hypothetical protein|uniref:hypothetical protein n=1 Tax=Paraburkholderia sp. GAS448 TaxID=3035136 RepID=UPI003D26055B
MANPDVGSAFHTQCPARFDIAFSESRHELPRLHALKQFRRSMRGARTLNLALPLFSPTYALSVTGSNRSPSTYGGASGFWPKLAD